MRGTICAKLLVRFERDVPSTIARRYAMQDDRTFGKALLLFAFWAYVLIPLGTGIWSTLGKALALFS